MRPYPETYAEALDIVEECALRILPVYEDTRGVPSHEAELESFQVALDTLSRFRSEEDGLLASFPPPPLKTLVRFKGCSMPDDPADKVSAGLISCTELATSRAPPPDGTGWDVRVHEEGRLHQACDLVGHLVAVHRDAINTLLGDPTPKP